MSAWYAYVLFFVIVTGVLGGVHYYLWRRLVRDVHMPTLPRKIVSGLLAGLLVLLMVSFPLFRVLPFAWQTPVMYVAFTWMGVMFLLVTTLAVRDFGLLAGRAFAPQVFNRERRLFVAQASALGVGAITGGVSAFSVREAIKALHVNDVEVPVAESAAALKGYRLVQVTDIHVGPTIKKDFIEAMVAQINALEADVVAITGDLVDGSTANLGEHVAPLANIRAKHGVYFVPGNHEYYSGLREWMAFIDGLGIRVLLNDRVRIGEGERVFDLVGLDDETGRPDIDAAVAGRPADRPLVVLAHQPRTIKQVRKHAPVLQLSGHTHAGQIWPFNYLVRLAQPYVGGLHKDGDTHIYVSPGTGYWGPPMRLGTQAEITHVRLV